MLLTILAQYQHIYFNHCWHLSHIRPVTIAIISSTPTNITPPAAYSASSYTYTNQSNTPEPWAVRVSLPDYTEAGVKGPAGAWEKGLEELLTHLNSHPLALTHTRTSGCDLWNYCSAGVICFWGALSAPQCAVKAGEKRDTKTRM